MVALNEFVMQFALSAGLFKCLMFGEYHSLSRQNILHQTCYRQEYCWIKH